MQPASTSDPRVENLQNIMSHFIPHVQDIVVHCPGCKTLEALSFEDGRLMQTRKFSQRDGLVFHDCGTEQPCRLYRP